MRIKMETLLCTTVKLENNYIEEWVRYYQELGIDKIVIFDNNSTNGEHITDVPYVKELAEQGYIIVVPQYDARGIQTAQYTECYNLFYKDYDWIMFFDVDEYLTFENCSNIKEYLSQEKFNGFDMIHVQWKIFDDNEQLYVKDGNYSLRSRFTHALDTDKLIAYEDENNGSYAYFYHKTILRGRNYHKIKFVGGNSHTVDKNSDTNLKACDINGKTVDAFDMAHKPIKYADAYLSHYICKTLEEYITNKMVRKTGATASDNDPNERVDLRLFFKYNKLTFEKLQYIHKLLPKECDRFLNFLTLCYGKYSHKFDAIPMYLTLN